MADPHEINIFSTTEAASALAGLRQPAEDAASAIDQAFGRAGESLARSLARAAGDGKLSFAELARAAISAADSLIGGGSGSGGKGLGEALSSLVTSAFSGARADGGPVTRGGAYLVGERGPELFRPSTSGAVESAGEGGGVTVNLNLAGADAQALVRSEAQIAQALARAVALGAR